MTSCKMLPNCLPKLSKPSCYTLLSLWNGGIAGRPDIQADVSISKRFHSGTRGNPERVFFKSTRGKNISFLLVDGGIRIHDSKTMHGLSTKPFAKGIEGYIVYTITSSPFDLLLAKD